MKVRPFLKTQRESSVFKKMIFVEANKFIVGHLHSLFFVFAADEAFFDKFLWIATVTGSAYSSFWCILKTTSPSTEEKNYLICQFTVRILCPTLRPWDLTQNRGSHGKTVRPGRFLINRTLIWNVFTLLSRNMNQFSLEIKLVSQND